jgi:predicted TPR repeat methyltransferase
VVANFTTFLAEEIASGAKYDLVLAADVFVYINDPAAIIAAVARVIAARGIFAFTVETHSGAGIELLPTLRFAYGAPYLRDVVAHGGLKLLKLEKAVIRTEKAAPVQGLVLVASA